ncbi:MAG: hypothetical protein ACQET5_01340 [Halobacteriota archaeon]|uniref:hypothetical protein n=1 Tax=Natronomonas sp. TaxID=2184060 RepID=UPI003976434C
MSDGTDRDVSLPDDDSPIVHPEAVDRTFDWRGWSLVGAIFVAFLLVPGLIYLYPHAPSNVGLSFWDTYLVLPMIPAIVLGLLAVWATTRP